MFCSFVLRSHICLYLRSAFLSPVCGPEMSSDVSGLGGCVKQVYECQLLLSSHL
jgi:hypothetical protein